MQTFTGSKGNFPALLPLLLFVFTFLGAGIYLDDFYAFPAPIAVIPGIILAFFLLKGTVENRITAFLKGCGEERIMTMCLIYLLAGAFTEVCKATGSVEAVVDLGLQYISVNYLYAGVFIIAAFLSFSTGTSVGAIVALLAIVNGFADRTGASLAVLNASLLGGAMFGDNLSFISDTTIAATQTLGCEMKDKFKQNFRIAFPAAVATIAILLVMGSSLVAGGSLSGTQEVEWIKVVPYLLVITLAVAGYNVFLVLLAGTLGAGLIGIINADFGFVDLATISYGGFTGMTDIFLLSMLTGGLAAMVAAAGGLTYISNLITKRISVRSSYFSIGALVGITNLAIANNTVSILVSGTVAREINDRLNLNRVKVASVLDIFACVIQGILPYGAQVLLLLSYANGRFGYFDLVANAWYIWLLLGGAVIYLSWKRRQIPQASLIG